MVLAIASSRQEVVAKKEPPKTICFVKIPVVVLDCQTICASALKLWAVIIRYDWYGKGCYPSQAQLAKDMNLGDRRIRDLLAKLETAKLVEIIHRREQYRSSLYQFPTLSGEFVMLPHELLENSDLKPETLKLWLVLKKLARRFSACSPTLAELANLMQLQPRRLRDLIKELENAGLITVHRNASPNLSNIYCLKSFGLEENLTKPFIIPEGNFVPETRQSSTTDPAINHRLPLQNFATESDSLKKINQDSQPEKFVAQNKLCEVNSFVSLLLENGISSSRASKLAQKLVEAQKDISYLENAILASRSDTVRNRAAYLVYLLEHDIVPTSFTPDPKFDSKHIPLSRFNRANKPIDPHRSKWLTKLGLVKTQDITANSVQPEPVLSKQSAKPATFPVSGVADEKNISAQFVIRHIPSTSITGKPATETVDCQKLWRELVQEVANRFDNQHLSGRLQNIILIEVTATNACLKLQHSWQERLFSSADKTLLSQLLCRKLGRKVAITFV
jgi:Helix-turn-helix domain